MNAPAITAGCDARHSGDAAAGLGRANRRSRRPRPRSEHARDQAAETALQAADPKAGNDADYVFITFILRYLPHGVIGLLVAAFFAAALSSKAGELNALGSTTTVDFYRHVVRAELTDAHFVARVQMVHGRCGGWSRSPSRSSRNWPRT